MRKSLTFINFFIFIIGMAVGVSIRDYQYRDLAGYNQNPSITLDVVPCSTDAVAYTMIFEKSEEEGTGTFFERLKTSMTCMRNGGYSIYACIPIMHPNQPTIIGAEIMYFKKETDDKKEESMGS